MSHFIGYETLEAWAAVADPARPVYALPIVEPGPTGSTGLRRDTLAIVCAQTDGDAVHYCRLVIAVVAYVGKTAFDPDHQDRKDRHDQAWEIVLAWLEERFVTVRPGLIAMPQDYRILDGWANFLRWDNNTRRFYRAGADAGEKNQVTTAE